MIAACSPRLHGPTWQELLRRSQLNPAVVEVANIREQCSWVHLHAKAEGTQKALELVRMAVARAELLQPVAELTVPVTQRALVIGGGWREFRRRWILPTTVMRRFWWKKAPPSAALWR